MSRRVVTGVTAALSASLYRGCGCPDKSGLEVSHGGLSTQFLDRVQDGSQRTPGPDGGPERAGLRPRRPGDPKSGQPVDFVAFARTEERFARHFDANGQPDESLKQAQEGRLENWRLLQELAGLR